MNTDIDFMKIAEGDKAFVRDFENFVNGKVSSTEKTGMAMTGGRILSLFRFAKQCPRFPDTQIIQLL